MARQKTFFGQLEQAILDCLWTQGSGTVRDVLTCLRAERRVAYTTVMTVMNRLVEHGYLRRQPGPSGAFRYSPRQTRDHFSAAVTRQTVDQLVRHYGDAALVQFLDRLDHVPADKLQRLKRRLRDQA